MEKPPVVTAVECSNFKKMEKKIKLSLKPKSLVSVILV